MTGVTASAKKNQYLDPSGQTSMLRLNCNTETESKVVCNTVLLKKGKKKVGEESVNEVLSSPLQSCQGPCTGRCPGEGRKEG